MKRFFATLLILVFLMGSFSILTGCNDRQSDDVSYNLSLEADNFNVTRRVTVINLRTDTILFQITGNFSIENEADGDMSIIGQDSDGTFYKHFVKLAPEITCITEQIATNAVNKYKYTINFNPKMIIPVEVKTVE